MHLVFVDVIVGYTAAQPDLEAPLGGTTSAVCFLARELKALGIDVTLCNRTKEKTTEHGVTSVPLSELGDLCQNSTVSAFIFCGRWLPQLVSLVRSCTKKPLIAWMHETVFEPKATAPLPEFDGVAFISNWQKKTNEKSILPHWKTALMRNAMNPRFVTLFEEGEPLTNGREEKPVLLYAGDFQRGAFHIPSILGLLKQSHTDFTTEIYTNEDAITDPTAAAQYFHDLRQNPYIRHIGKVSQNELTLRMKKASIFLAPNPWPETSCINLIQAMAAGLLVVTTNRAVLPETAHGFARLVPIENNDDPLRFDMNLDYAAFAQSLGEALNELRDKAALEEKLKIQRTFFLQNYQWKQRAQPWIDYLMSFECA